MKNLGAYLFGTIMAVPAAVLIWISVVLLSGVWAWMAGVVAVFFTFSLIISWVVLFTTINRLGKSYGSKI